MTDLFLLLLLLTAQTIKVCSQPYKPDSHGTCLKPTEYLPDGLNLCCKKCPPGRRKKQECSETAETECEQCPTGQYLESWNYSPNCFSCDKCKSNKGLQYGQNCSYTQRSRCECQPGMYCILGFDDPYCSACRKYTLCRGGYGVSVPGTANSDVKCEQCPDGTFSDTVSHTVPCRLHTNCHGRVAIRKGNATSDTVCAPEALISNTQPQTSTKEPHTEIVFTTASTMTSTVSATSDSKAPRGLTGPTPSISHLTSVLKAVFNHSTKSPPPRLVSDSKLAAVIGGVTGVIFLIIVIFLLFLCKAMWKKDAARLHPKIDANGNCESGVKINQGYLGETQLTSFIGSPAEQQNLLEKGEAYRDQSQCSNNTETLTRTHGCSNHESIGPLQSTTALHNPHSALPEPLTLLSNTEPVTPQPSIPTQSSSQPTSPQIISTVTNSPSVNFNITFQISNGSIGTPATDFMQADSKLPFGEEEESVSIPQQEAGKQSQMSVQESESYSA
ncbi:tumor necrosis factor receptor superfamily member 1B [Enoplosus armatus]|uniref:tumor necrosis factor receptor superfamily member 1B n=1 Tax=Enoplosus armatus TaxID=215367 RepID=UPI0039934310